MIPLLQLISLLLLYVDNLISFPKFRYVQNGPFKNQKSFDVAHDIGASFTFSNNAHV